MQELHCLNQDGLYRVDDIRSKTLEPTKIYISRTIKYIQYRLRRWRAASQLIDQELTVTATAKNHPSVSTRSYLINSNRRHPAGAVQIRDQQTNMTKCRNVSIMQPTCSAFLEFLIYSRLTSKLTC